MCKMIKGLLPVDFFSVRLRYKDSLNVFVLTDT